MTTVDSLVRAWAQLDWAERWLDSPFNRRRSFQLDRAILTLEEMEL